MNKSSKISNEDRKLFRDTVGNIKPIKDNNVITDNSKTPPYSKKNKEKYINSDYEINENRLNEKSVNSEEEIRFCSAGENDKKFKRLRQGKYKFKKTLDLHGMRVDEAKKELVMFLEECKVQAISCVLIIHGKGYGSKNKSPIIKNKLNQWLKNNPVVWGFCSAKPNDGGTGAIYVYFKKN